MAVPAVKDYQEQGTLGEAVEMTIDPDGMQFLMSILTNLYEHPIEAVEREYVTNGIDAHIEAGIDRPVEVTLPTAFRKEFRVRDFGVGMDGDDIRNTYSKYVASTKRQTNTQAGMFGIGSKSALAYDDRFTVESVKNGKKVIGVITRKGRRAATINMFESTTDEPNGTTIVVPVREHDVTRWRNTAHRLFKYLRPGKVLVDGEDLGGTFGGTRVDEDNYVIESQWNNNESVIVMGNVPYRVDVVGQYDKRRFVHYADVGEFEPTPPREGLERDEGFTDKIDKILNHMTTSLADSVNKELSSMDPHEASKFVTENYNEWTNWGVEKHVQYKGVGLDDTVAGDYVIARSSSTHRDDDTTLYNLMRGSHVYGLGIDDVEDLTKYMIGKCYYHRVNGQTIIWLNGDKPKYGLEDRIRNWDDAKKKASTSSSTTSHGNSLVKAGDDWKVPTKAPRWESYTKGTFSYGKHNLKVVPYEEWEGADDDRSLVYFTPTELTGPVITWAVQMLFEDEDVFLVVKYKNQFEKTERETPEAVHLMEFIGDYVKEMIESIGEEKFFSARESIPEGYKGELFDKAEKFRDLESYTSNGISRELYNVAKEYAGDALKTQTEYDRLVAEINDRYPLFGRYNEEEHNQEYIHAMDAYRKEN